MPEIMTEPDEPTKRRLKQKIAQQLGPVIHFPSEEENRTHLAETLRTMRANCFAHHKAAQDALPALERLCEVLKARSGQPYKLRALLWSLYNGKPASLIEIVNFDWEIRKDLCAFLLGFGFEKYEVKCFYDAVRAAVTKAGQWAWFEEESDNVQRFIDELECRDYTVTPHRHTSA